MTEVPLSKIQRALISGKKQVGDNDDVGSFLED
jgi:hypothetical protein